MEKIALSVVTIVTMSSLAFAGGDMKDVTPVVEPVVAIPVVEEERPFYVGLGLSAVSTRNSNTSLNFFSAEREQDRTGDILLMAGYEFNPYVAVEGRYMTSVVDEDVLTRDSWGIYVKPQYPVNEEFTLYALLGYGGLTVDGKGSALIPRNRSDVDDNGFQWGLGGSYAVTENVAIFADYVSIATDMDADIFWNSLLAEVDSDAFTVGVNYNF